MVKSLLNILTSSSPLCILVSKFMRKYINCTALYQIWEVALKTHRTNFYCSSSSVSAILLPYSLNPAYISESSSHCSASDISLNSMFLYRLPGDMCLACPMSGPASSAAPVGQQQKHLTCQIYLGKGL